MTFICGCWGMPSGEQKGEKPVENLECLVDIQIEAHIPEKYIPSLAQRIDIYKKIAAIRTEDDWSDTMDELCDRFGEPPRSVAGLLDVALIRSRAAALGVRRSTSGWAACCSTVTG